MTARYHVFSDLHLDHLWDGGESWFGELKHHLKAKNVILAGDIWGLADEDGYVDTLKEFRKHFRRVYVVPGNHEFFGAWPSAMERIEKQVPGVEFLFNTVSKNGKIFGSTMFYNITPNNHDLWTSFIDSWKIPGAKGLIDDTYQKFLNLYHKNEAPVIVTHHAPSLNSLHEAYRGSPANDFFITNLPESWIAGLDVDGNRLRRAPKYWIHGHVHNAFNYRLGDTEVICNPYGYTSEQGHNGFSWEKVISV